MHHGIFISSYSQHTCIQHKHINQWHIETTVNAETHLGKNTKVLFIWYEKYVSTFCLRTQLVDSSLGILLQFMQTSLPSCSMVLGLDNSSILHSSIDQHTTWIIPLVKTTILFSSLPTQWLNQPTDYLANKTIDNQRESHTQLGFSLL